MATWLFLAGFFLAAGASSDSPEEMQFDFANGLFRRSYYDMAAEQYRAYLKQFPKGGHAQDAMFRLGESEYGAQRYSEALHVFDDLLKKNPEGLTRLRAQLRKGEILSRLRKNDEARGVLEPLTAVEMDQEIRSGALYYLGKVNHESNNHEAAVASLKKLVEEIPASALVPYARQQLAFVYLSMDQPEKAAIEFSAVAASNADEKLRMECRFRAAETYDKIGWFDAAVVAYRELQQEFPGTDYAERALYGYAWALYHASQYADAAKTASEFVEKHPGTPRTVGTQYLLGNCLQQQGDLDQALAIYQGIRKEHPDSEFAARSQYKTAWVLHQMGKTDEAEREVSDFLAKHTDTPMRGDAGFLRGVILAAKGNHGDAYEEFRLVAEKYTDSEFAAEALYKAGECLAQMGRTDEAGKVFEAFATKYPDNILAERAILRVGDAQFFAAAFGEAITRYQGILANQPDPAVEQETLYRMAITYHNMQKYEDSANTFRKILGKFPNSVHVAEAHLRIGDYLLRDANKPVESIAEFQAAYDADPKGPYAGLALRGLALARYENKDLDGSTEMFLRIVADYPSVRLNEKAYAEVGQRLFDQKKWEQAATVFKTMIKALPDYPNPERVRFRIAECSEMAGNADEAIKLYQTVVDKASRSSAAVEARWRMGKLHEGRNQMDKALELYETAANADTSDTAAQARFHIGEIYEGKGDYDTAARNFMRVAILLLHEKLSPESLWRAGQCFEKAGKPDQAGKAYKELVEDFPSSEQAAKAAEHLKQMG